MGAEGAKGSVAGSEEGLVLWVSKRNRYNDTARGTRKAEQSSVLPPFAPTKHLTCVRFATKSITCRYCQRREQQAKNRMRTRTYECIELRFTLVFHLAQSLLQFSLRALSDVCLHLCRRHVEAWGKSPV